MRRRASGCSAPRRRPLSRYSWERRRARDARGAAGSRAGARLTCADLAIVIVSYNARARPGAGARVAGGRAAGHLARDRRGGQRLVGRQPRSWSASAGPRCGSSRPEPTSGSPRANNLGIRATAGDLVLLLNSDTVVPPGAIDALVADLLAHPEAAVAGPRLVDGPGRAEMSFGRMMTRGRAAPEDPRAALRCAGSPWPRGWSSAAWLRRAVVDWVSGACLLVRRADAEAVGLLDERFFLYTEDVDFCAAHPRARGGQVRFTPAAEVVHLRGRSRGARPARRLERTTGAASWRSTRSTTPPGTACCAPT